MSANNEAFAGAASANQPRLDESSASFSDMGKPNKAARKGRHGAHVALSRKTLARTACDRRELLGLSRSRGGALVLGDDFGQRRPGVEGLALVAQFRERRSRAVAGAHQFLVVDRLAPHQGPLHRFRPNDVHCGLAHKPQVDRSEVFDAAEFRVEVGNEIAEPTALAASRIQAGHGSTEVDRTSADS
jgi:hypothetical protein